MFGSTIGPGEILIVLLIALVIFGPKRLPELGQGLGRGMRDFRRAVSGDDEPEHGAGEPSLGAPAIVATATPVTTLIRVAEAGEAEPAEANAAPHGPI